MIEIGYVFEFMESRGAEYFVVPDDFGIEKAKEGKKIILLYEKRMWEEHTYHQINLKIQDQQIKVHIIRMPGRAVFKFSSGGIIQLRTMQNLNELYGLDLRDWLWNINMFPC